MLLDVKIVRCPQCGGDSIYAQSNPNRPFCSGRCKGIDLGAWANQEFRVPTEFSPEEVILEEKKLL